MLRAGEPDCAGPFQAAAVGHVAAQHGGPYDATRAVPQHQHADRATARVVERAYGAIDAVPAAEPSHRAAAGGVVSAGIAAGARARPEQAHRQRPRLLGRWPAGAQLFRP
eukprot:156385-Chlamydomonas_euryale.AAC.1